MLTSFSAGNMKAAASSKYFTKDQLASIDLKRVPHHIAFIPDGNRRWAKKNFFKIPEGHRKGGQTLIEICKAGKEIGVKVFTFYLFSTENWSRPQWEIDALMHLLKSFLIEQRPTLLENGIRLNTIGNVVRFPQDVLDTLYETEKITAQGENVDLVLALNYGGRDDIRRAFQVIMEEYDNHKFIREEVTEAMISRYLDTHRWPDPDLLIRTSNELRVSNFLLWQISYSEIYITDILWPDFKPSHLLEALVDFQKRERRLGGS